MGIKVYAKCRIGNDFLLITSTGLQHREQACLAEVQSVQLRTILSPVHLIHPRSSPTINICIILLLYCDTGHGLMPGVISTQGRTMGWREEDFAVQPRRRRL